MALKDRLNDALAATPVEDTVRRASLQAVLDAAGDGDDTALQAVIARQIAAREQKAASYAAAGQAAMAKAERAEIDALRKLLRAPSAPAPQPSAPPKAAKAPKKTAPAEAEGEPAKALLSTKQLVLIGIAGLVLAALAYYFFGGFGGGDKTAALGTAIVVRADDRTMGDPNAPVKMLEYAAPTCPHCGHFNTTVMPKIKAEYIDTGKVFYIFRTFPLNNTDGAVEAIGRKCIPADKYFDFLDLMFRNQPKWDPDGYQIPDVRAAVIQMAGMMGVTPDQATACMTDPEEKQRINEVSADAVNRYQIHGTPSFIINGEPFGATEASWEQMKAKFDALLAKK